MANKNARLDLKWLKYLSNEELRHKAMSRQAVVVYSAALDRVIWANASGAALFGGTTIGPFLAAKIKSKHPFLQQLKAAVRQLDDEPIFRGFRVVDDGQSRFLQCEIGYVELSDGKKSFKKSVKKFKPGRKKSGRAIIVSCANSAMEELPEHEFGQLIVDNLRDFGAARAICDQYGLVISATDKFAQSQIPPQVMEEAFSSLGEKGSTAYSVKDEDGSNLELDMYLLATKPKRILVLAQNDEQSGAAKDSHAQLSGDASKQPAQGQNGDNSKPDYIPEQPISVRIEPTDDKVGEEKKPKRGKKAKLLAGEKGKPASGKILQDGAADGDMAEDFVFIGDSDPVRFAWITDTNQVFTSVSPELAKAVGPNAADIIGRKWSDIAAVFDFDSSGEIKKLLQKQDTWSGKSVLWPIQGTDLQVPIDLAALPSFSSGRDFEGFRGFGIVRLLDTIVDPEEAGLALINGGLEKIQDEIPDDDGKPAGANNIVELSSRRDNGGEDALVKGSRPKILSKGENRAFYEIGNKLRDTTQNRVSTGQSGDQKDDEGSAGEKSISENSGNTRPRQIDAPVLARLPVPVLVYRGNETLFANKELLNLTGYDDFEELAAAGGVDALLNVEKPDEIVDENDTILSDKDGGQMRVKALLQRVPWDEKDALLLSFRQPRHEKLPPNEKIVLDMMRVSELHNVLDTAADGIIIVDKKGIVQSVNKSAEALFGRVDEDISEKSINELFAEESHGRIEEYLASLDAANSKSLLNNGCEVIGLEAKGRMIPLYITIGSIGASDKYCAILRDMTSWKKTREELLEAKKQAEQASEQKTEFLARVSHEIRTPLNAIIGFSDVMIEERFGPIDNERYREYLRDINRSGTHVLDLINDLLDISKIEAGKMELSFEAVDLNQIVGETVALLQPQANGNRVLIRTSLSRAVPRVVADARSIRQIVLNLVSNAIKFTDANGQVIVSTVYEGNGEVALRVRDTGHGMSEEEVAIALKPFRQVNIISETRGKGTGLGLPLTKALVEANKAYLDIDSKPGEGTIVHIQFPTQRVLADN